MRNNENTAWPQWADLAVGEDVRGLYDRAFDAWQAGADAQVWREQNHPALTRDSLEEIINKLLPECSFEYDNFGQLIIYTNKMVAEDGSLVPLVFDEDEKEEIKNREGLTLDEWLSAAGLGDVHGTEALEAWDKGEDPTEWRKSLEDERVRC